MSANELCILDPSGDTKTIWDPSQPDEVENARETFNRMRAKGYLAYLVMGDGEKGEAITKFDPKAGKLILCPPLRGG